MVVTVASLKSLHLFCIQSVSCRCAFKSRSGNGAPLSDSMSPPIKFLASCPYTCVRYIFENNVTVSSSCSVQNEFTVCFVENSYTRILYDHKPIFEKCAQVMHLNYQTMLF